MYNISFWLLPGTLNTLLPPNTKEFTILLTYNSFYLYHSTLINTPEVGLVYVTNFIPFFMDSGMCNLWNHLTRICFSKRSKVIIKGASFISSADLSCKTILKYVELSDIVHLFCNRKLFVMQYLNHSFN